MPVNTVEKAREILTEAYGVGDECTVCQVVTGWDGPTILRLLDSVIDDLDSRRVSLLGIRITQTDLNKTGLKRDRRHSATYRGVRLVESVIDFDTIELDFRPAQDSK